MTYTRYAIYYAPRPGAFADAATSWFADPSRHAVTVDPRRYGFHGTIKAPFRLAEGADLAGLSAACADLAARLAPVELPGLRLSRLGGFLALTPEGCEAALLELGAEVVTSLDPFRAPLTPAEVARRKPDRLTPRQRDLLALWGYPYVMEEFRFHLTLTDSLADPAPVEAQAAAHFAPLPQPFAVQDLCIFGEGAGGFHLLHRHALTG